MKWVTLALLVPLGLSTALLGQSQTRQQPRTTFDSVITLPDQNLPRPPASVAGIVTSEVTGEPLPGATVTLSRRMESFVIALLLEEGPAPVIDPVRTDERGGFSFKDVAAGAYSLSVRVDGYLPKTLGERVEGAQGTWLALAPGESRTDVKVPLVRSARIEGQIRNEAGQGLDGIPVAVLQPGSYFRGAATKSSGDGTYGLEGFPPGSYVLIAGLPLELNGEPARSFATPLVVPGVDAQTINFLLEEKGTHTIRGKVRLQDAGASPAQVRITMRIASPLAASNNPWVNMNIPYSYDSNAGTFAISGLLPGVYLVTASVGGLDNTITCGTATAVVSQGDITGLDLILTVCGL